jgi:uncharacterized protein YsxB (DUF464 family)
VSKKFPVTRITLFWGKDGLVGLESQGHSGGGVKGEDVVCAAVSSLVQALLVGLRVAKVSANCEIDSSAPLIRARWAESEALGLNLLTQTIVLSLREIASGRAGHVSISEVYLS